MRVLPAPCIAPAGVAAALLGTIALALPAHVAAQAWILQGGVTASGEYSDNYFLAPVNKESAFTGTVAPFVRVARKTETSDITGLLAVGANKVWGLPDSTDFLSVNFNLTGTLREARSTLSGTAAFVRAPTLQEVSGATGVVLALAYTNTAVAGGTYTYALTERWSVGATAGWTGNSYEAVPGSVSASALSDNDQYTLGGSLDFAYSDRTRLALLAVVSRYTSDVTESDSLTTTFGVAHELSPRFRVSASVGGFWSDIQLTQAGLVCPTTPLLCDTGVVQRVFVTSSEKRRDSGVLYGGSISYDFSERTRLAATLSENLSPSSTGTVTRTDDAAVSLSHQFSERLNGSVGLAYTRSKTPAGLTAASTTDSYGGGVGMSYKLAERWSLDSGYRYRRAKYSQDLLEPESNLIFLSVAYNSPGASLTDWMDMVPDRHGSPGAGPLSLPQR